MSGIFAGRSIVLVFSPRGASFRTATEEDLAEHHASLEAGAEAIAEAPAPAAAAPAAAPVMEQAMELAEPEEDDAEEEAVEKQPKPKREYKRCTHGHASKKACDICSKEKRAPRKKKAVE